MLCISMAYAVIRCLCVRVSVMFVICVKMNKHIIKILSPSGSEHYSSFSVPNGMAIF